MLIEPGFDRQWKFAAFDMDSCILGHECIDELATEMGVGERVADITRRSMAGELDFVAALRERVGLLQGMDESRLDKVWQRLYLNPGAVKLIKALKQANVKTALVSGGFTRFTHPVAARLGMDYAFSNTLEIKDGTLTGKVAGSIVDGNMKEKVVRLLAERENVKMEEVVTMGDGANDQYMVRAAGLGVAYHGKAILKGATPHHINNNPLQALLYYMNIPPAGGPQGKVLASSLPVLTQPADLSLEDLLQNKST